MLNFIGTILFWLCAGIAFGFGFNIGKNLYTILRYALIKKYLI